MRVLVIAAHPDDELLGVGGTILRHVQDGDDVYVHIECVGGLRDEDERLEVAKSIADDAGYYLSRGHSRQLGSEPIDLDAVVASVSPRVIFTHHPGDLNRDHRLVSEAVQVATRPFTSNVASLRYFDTPSSTEWGSGFAPNLFVDIDAHLAEKVHLLARYGTEMRPFPHPRSQDALIDRARYWGQISGYRAAEAFVIARERW